MELGNPGCMLIGGGPGGLPLADKVDPMFMPDVSPGMTVGAWTGGPPLLGGGPPAPFDALTCIAQAFSPDGAPLLVVGCDQAVPAPPGDPALDIAAPAASNA
mmetsp:Transcript_94830/g.164587  ORF Transcript_94830/g.164587 Transcript_94830/m.164587 type:complete len:102 (+) Transcript_94830:559-864(+)